MRRVLPILAFALVSGCGAVGSASLRTGASDAADTTMAADPGAMFEGGALTQGRGSLSRAQIRQVIRVHINEIRICYEAGLEQERTLAGRVVTSFVVGSDGSPEIASSTMSPRGSVSDTMEQCVRDALRAFVFPRPDGGAVLVNYPFVLDSLPES